SIMTPNKKEAERAAGRTINDLKDLSKVAREIQLISQCQAVLITRGEEGMSLFEDGEQIDIPTVAREVFDVTGVGDPVIAILALTRAAGASVLEAALMANHAAGIVVAKVGTASASVEELRRSLTGEVDVPKKPVRI